MITGNWQTREVRIRGRILSPKRSQKLVNSSPCGFNWGYGGSGPAQLAMALLLRFTDKKTALRYYQKFKWAVIARLPQADFQMDEAVVWAWLMARERQEKEEV